MAQEQPIADTKLPEGQSNIKIDAERTHAILEAACQWGRSVTRPSNMITSDVTQSTPDGGMDRLACNDDDKRVRDWFIEETRKCGCFHRIDEMGNIFAIRPGENNDLPPIALGSHLDTQPTGGKYDGILGIVSAMEVLQVIHTNNITTYAPLAVVNWTNEEGARFPPAMLCSGVWGGAFTVEWASARADANGITIGDELQRIGYRGPVACSYEANPLLAHFELHIEQGPILDQAEQATSVVLGVQSIRWYNVVVRGREAHTGTTPMDRRSDALLGVAKMIVETNKIVTESEVAHRGGRATIAVINSSPQSINTIAGSVEFGLDIRAPVDTDVELIEGMCRDRFQGICSEHGLTMTIENFWVSPAVRYDETMIECVRQSSREIGCTMELTSGAGHDSVYTSRKCPTAMIFVRCKDGVSHNPTEYSRREDCAAGAQVLLGAFLRYDDYVRATHT